MTVNVKKILVPVDFSIVSSKSLEYAVAMAKSFGSEILLVHVVEESSTWGVELNDPVNIKERWEKEEFSKARATLEEYSSSLPSSLKVTTQVFAGDVASLIVACLIEEKCDMLIMGAHGSSGILSDWLGGVAYKVSKKAPCPVLMVRQKD